MLDRDPQELREMLASMLQPWHDAIADPAKAQEKPCCNATSQSHAATGTANSTARTRSAPSPTSAARSP